jgi:hypothetical protein
MTNSNRWKNDDYNMSSAYTTFAMSMSNAHSADLD